MDTKVWRLAMRLGHNRCFYTGLECLFYDIDRGHRGMLDQFPQAATREHLIPKARCRLGDRDAERNIVLACSVMNNLVANAPLAVKLEVRDAIQPHLQGVEDLDEDVQDCIEGQTAKVLNQYRIGRKYPWQLSSFTRKKEREVMAAFLDSVSEQEHAMFREHFLVEESPFWLPVSVDDANP